MTRLDRHRRGKYDGDQRSTMCTTYQVYFYYVDKSTSSGSSGHSSRHSDRCAILEQKGSSEVNTSRRSGPRWAGSHRGLFGGVIRKLTAKAADTYVYKHGSGTCSACAADSEGSASVLSRSECLPFDQAAFPDLQCSVLGVIEAGCLR